jgi:hypothetical protein
MAGSFHFLGSATMRRFLSVVLAAMLLVILAGCYGEKDKGVNKGKDLPRSGDKE